jgi:hypothetical protein
MITAPGADYDSRLCKHLHHVRDIEPQRNFRSVNPADGDVV